MTDTLPKKLKRDAIVESLLEMRFDTSANSSVPEIFFGRLADTESWHGFSQQRLPVADIPAPMRRANPDLRYSPVLQLRDPDGSRLVQIGPQVISFHRHAPYNGWDAFRDELHETVQRIFDTVGQITVRRLGLRYLNALGDLHDIGGVGDLNLQVLVGGESTTTPMNLNLLRKISPHTSCQVRIATPEFVQGQKSPEQKAYLDIDVYTEKSFKAVSAAEVFEWMELAHDEEKKSFFKLLRPETIKALREE